MKALLVYCHPSQTSFTAAVCSVVQDHLERAGAEIRLIDLYGEGFDPVLAREEWTGYLDYPTNCAGVSDHAEALLWADTLIFVYPTWWYGLPAILKGWLDRVLVPEVAFSLPADGDIKPGLRHITRFGVFTTCGASQLLSYWVGQPGKRTLLRGLRVLCAKQLKSCYVAHYNMDQSTPRSRAQHLEKVAKRMDRLLS